jgi:hypothetical protein
MSELMQLQNQLQRYLLSGHAEIYDSIEQTQSVAIDLRLSIYKNAYNSRLIESLAANYPNVYAYLGTEQFNQAANAYIDKYPSIYRSIRWYGDVFPKFIENFYSKYPYLAELAEFEWLMSLAFDAADEQVVLVENMMTLVPAVWPNLQFRLHPSVQRINNFWNAIELWEALANEVELPKLQKNAEPKAWVLWRTKDYRHSFYGLSKEEAWALDSLAQGMSFGMICEGLCQWIVPEEVGMRAASFLKGWIEKGMLSQLVF